MNLKHILFYSGNEQAGDVEEGGVYVHATAQKGQSEPGPNLGRPPTQPVMGPCPPRLLTNWLAEVECWGCH
jgi:hypothetical protein